jgi:hypothetical protein
MVRRTISSLCVVPLLLLGGLALPCPSQERQPVAYVENRGQWDGAFTHRARTGAMTLFVQERGWTFTLLEEEAPASRPHRGVAVRMTFGGAASSALPRAEVRLPGVHNYYLDDDPTRWRSGVPLHGAVRMPGLYPGIDVRLRSELGRFEYDLLVEPGADLGSVVMEVEGANRIRIGPDGELVIDTILGPVMQTLPKTWQITPKGNRQGIACDYVLKGEGRFGFVAPDWNPELSLVVDPGLVYSTFVGGSAVENAAAVAVDDTGAATICGSTSFSTYPTTSGAFQSSYGGGPTDAFVTRLDLSGALWYSTYLGTPGLDQTSAIALDATGAATVCGRTDSSSFPTTPGAFQTTYGGGTMDAFVTRLDPTGGGLLFSTYLGGSQVDRAKALDLDAIGATTVTGETGSPGFPATSSVLQQNGGGLGNVFVARLGPSGSTLSYSMRVAGSSSDSVHGLAVDVTGAAIIFGQTSSPNLITSPGAFQPGFGGGASDTFLARFDSTGGVSYATYLGGSGDEYARGVALDATGAATVGGETDSHDFPTSAGALQPSLWGGVDIFVTRLAPAGSAIWYSGYLGRSGNDLARSLGVDATGAVTVCGLTHSPNFPTTQGALQPTYQATGGGEMFVTRLCLGVGQGNSPEASLIANGVGLGACCGPFSVPIDPGGVLTLDWAGPQGQPAALFAGPTNPANASLGCSGSLDIGTPPTYVDLDLLFSGTLSGYPHALFLIGSSGTVQQMIPVPVLPPGPLGAIQGIVLQPSSTCPVVLTAAFALVVN